MSHDDANQHHPVHDREASPNVQLQEVRARVATLCQRIKASRNPDDIRSVQEQLGRVGKLLGRNREHPRTHKQEVNRG